MLGDLWGLIFRALSALALSDHFRLAENWRRFADRPIRGLSNGRCGPITLLAMGRGLLREVPACLHCGCSLMLQQTAESESVRNQQQRHNDTPTEACVPRLATESAAVM